MSWITDLYAWLTTCRDKIWTRQSYKLPESHMEMEQRLPEETGGSSDTCFGIGTLHPLKWWNSSSTSKCPSTLQDNTFDIEQPPSMSSLPATPSYRNSTTTQEFYEVSLK